MARSWQSDPGYRAWAAHVEDSLVPKLEASSANCMLWSDRSELSINQAVELGVSVLMDKPILVVRPPGAPVPERLLRLADRVIEADLSKPGAHEQVARQVRDFLDDIGAADGS